MGAVNAKEQEVILALCNTDKGPRIKGKGTRLESRHEKEEGRERDRKERTLPASRQAKRR